jgi:hypothetical protein
VRATRTAAARSWTAAWASSCPTANPARCNSAACGLGTRLGHSVDVALIASVFGWNDPAGVLLANHGFALNDHQTPLFSRVGRQGSAVMQGREVFHELDDRPGYYVAGRVRYFDRVALSLLHYDNRADPTVFDAQLDDFAWETRFDTAGVRVESQRGWTSIVEWLGGETVIAPGPWITWDFEAWSALVSRKLGPHLLSLRRDEFYVRLPPWTDPGNEDGDAWTVAYRYDRGGALAFHAGVAARFEPGRGPPGGCSVSLRWRTSGSWSCPCATVCTAQAA